jgi:hypothetical protein
VSRCPLRVAHVHEGATRASDRVILARPFSHPRWRGGRPLFETWTHTTAGPFRPVGAHAVEFSKTAVPLAEGTPLPDTRELFRSRCGRGSIALARRLWKLRPLLPGLPFRRASSRPGTTSKKDSRFAREVRTACAALRRRGVRTATAPRSRVDAAGRRSRSGPPVATCRA